VDALWNTYDALHRDNTVIVQGIGVVAGTGGLGKTQVAIEYAHRFGTSYTGGVYWVDADRGLSTLISQVSEAAEIAADTKAEEEQQLAQLWSELNKLQLLLLVLDNFPEEIALRPYSPVTGRIHTLVTTCRQGVTEFPSVRPNVLLGDAGVTLLNSGTKQFDHAEAVALAERLWRRPAKQRKPHLSSNLKKAFVLSNHHFRVFSQILILTHCCPKQDRVEPGAGEKKGLG
jgi:hypothetical protein